MKFKKFQIFSEINRNCSLILMGVFQMGKLFKSISRPHPLTNKIMLLLFSTAKFFALAFAKMVPNFPLILLLI